MTEEIITDKDREIIFTEARTYSTWQDKDISDVLLQSVYDLMKWGPTSANCCPLRLIFLKSPHSKERLKPYLDEGNVEKTMKAPVTAILAYSLKFYENLPKLFPHADAKSWFENNESFAKETAFRNSSLQGAYFIIAARSLGLDCGPMSGFDKQGVKKEFFPGEDMEANFLCNLGYGDPSGLYPRSPRLSFEESCDIL